MKPFRNSFFVGNTLANKQAFEVLPQLECQPLSSNFKFRFSHRAGVSSHSSLHNMRPSLDCSSSSNTLHFYVSPYRSLIFQVAVEARLRARNRQFFCQGCDKHLMTLLQLLQTLLVLWTLSQYFPRMTLVCGNIARMSYNLLAISTR